MWNKVMKEVEAGRYAGPFDEPPFDYWVQSPIGLVPKAGNKTRLIFHLSYDFGSSLEERSINFHTPDSMCSVKYNDLDHAVKQCLRILKENGNPVEGTSSHTIVYSKTDCSNAFRLVPTLPEQRFLLILQATHPITGKKSFFVDKCLPFGSSISCMIFQSFSDALRYIAQIKIQNAAIVAYVPAITNYLDDFLFMALCVKVCMDMMNKFLSICKAIGCPMSQEKTEGPFPIMVFLGTLLNGVTHTLSIPVEKVDKATYLLNYAIDKKKVSIRFIQQLTGTLNFLNRAIVPGRVFTRGLYSSLKLRNAKDELLKPHHHIHLKTDFIQDCWVWLKFLRHKNNQKICRPFIDFTLTEDEQARETLFFYSDASKNPEFGIGAIFNQNWIVGKWNKNFILEQDPSIEFLELIALAAALMTWKDSHLLKNRRINIFCDNQAVQCMVNALASSCAQCRKLIRLIALLQIHNNIRVYVKFVKSKENGLADSLSRLDYNRFWKLAENRQVNTSPDIIHESIWPAEKVWFNPFNKLMNCDF